MPFGVMEPGDKSSMPAALLYSMIYLHDISCSWHIASRTI